MRKTAFKTSSIYLGISALLSRACALEIWNSFEDSSMTNGEETVFQYNGPTFISDDIEFSLFPRNMPPMHGDPEDGVYDIDFTFDSITFTLIDNSGATDLIFPEGRFDRYYIDIGSEIAEATLISSDNINAEISVIPPKGMTRELANLFNLDISQPNSKLFNGGIILQIGGGTDLTALGQEIRVEYSLVEPTVDIELTQMFLMMSAQRIIFDTVQRIREGLPLSQPDCFDPSRDNPQQIFCNTMPPEFEDIDDLRYIIHPDPRIVAGDNMDMYKSDPNIYHLVRINYKPVYEALQGPNSCSANMGVALAPIFWMEGENGDQRVQKTIMVTSFIADTSPYFRRDFRSSRKLKKGKSRSKNESTREESMERIMCGFNYVAERPA